MLMNEGRWLPDAVFPHWPIKSGAAPFNLEHRASTKKKESQLTHTFAVIRNFEVADGRKQF